MTRPGSNESADRDTTAPATADQLKALAHPLRLRILRLCLPREQSNQELADRLGIAPASTLRHVRELVAAGFLVPGEVRTGRRGALERPYRATGATWHLDTCRPDTPELARQLQNAAVAAHLAELQDAPDDAQRQQFRGTMRLEPAALHELTTKIAALVHEYGTRDDPDGVPVSFLWSLHGTE